MCVCLMVFALVFVCLPADGDANALSILGRFNRNVFLVSGVTQYTDMVKDFDENKENKTPEGSQNEVEWMQYELEREREEQELQQALAQSLQEQVRGAIPIPLRTGITIDPIFY